MADIDSLMVTKVTWMFDQFYFLSTSGMLYPCFVSFFILVVVISHIDLWQFMRKSKNELKKKQVRWFFLATAIGFGGGATCFLPPFDIKIYPYGNFAVALYPLIMSYAILKHKLMDINVVIRRTIIYSFFIFLVSTFYVLAIFTTHKLMIGEWDIRTSFSGINLFAVTSLLCGLGSLSLAIFAFIFGRSELRKIFGKFNVAVSIWGLGCFIVAISDNDHRASFGWGLTFLGGFYVAPLFYHMVIKICKLHSKRFLFFAYIQAILFTAALLFWPDRIFGPMRQAFNIQFVSMTFPLGAAIFMYVFIVIISYRQLFIFYRLAKGRERQQVGYVIYGFLFGFLGGTSILLPEFGINLIYPIGNVGTFIYNLILAYAIFRYQLLDLRIVISKTIFYTALIFIISLGYVVSIFAFRSFFIKEEITHAQLVNNIFLIIVISTLIKPIELFLHRALDNKFFHGSIEQIAEQKNKLKIELERRERLRSVGILAAGMAHEIKNPITAIKTFVDHIPAKHTDPEFMEKFSRIVNQELSRIKQIVTDLLLFSKPGEPVKRLCNINVILKDILELLNSELIKSHINLNAQLDPKANAYVDPEQAKQALLNVIMNAIDSMRGRGGELTIYTSKVGETINIQIIDAGCGMTPSQLTHIFDPFFTEKEGGTGLGLAITHSIVEKNAGKISVQSELNIGSTFIIELPTKPQ